MKCEKALKRPLSLRRRGGVLTDLASLGIYRRDIDQLLTYALDAIELAKRTRSGYIKRRIEGLENQLSSITSDRRILGLRQEISALSAID